MGLYKDLFNFAAKVGCLEGYLHERSDADISTMPNWVGNIERMYSLLPAQAKDEIREDYAMVLRKALNSYEKIPEKDEEIVKQLLRMVDELDRSRGSK